MGGAALFFLIFKYSRPRDWMEPIHIKAEMIFYSMKKNMLAYG